MEWSPEARDALALRLIPGIGQHLYSALLTRFGTVQAIRDASPEQLCEVPYLGAKVAQQVKKSLASADVDEEIRLLNDYRVGLVRLGSSAYPTALAEVELPPEMLFVRGDFRPDDRKLIAIVGSRQCTSYGKRIAEKLAFDLAHAGWTIVSGLARGIDACAHQGALNAGGRTIAVLAGGLKKIYPPEHAHLAEQVSAQGALVTESPMRMEPMRELFPARNRIISGMSRAVILVEAAEKSGALITARHAGEQGREVFAVPGPVDSPASAGVHELIRKGAKLVRHAGDVLEDIQGIAPLFAEPMLRPPPSGMDALQQSIWGFLEERRNVDDLARFTSKGVAELSGVLMTMEFGRMIRRLPGNEYERY